MVWILIVFIALFSIKVPVTLCDSNFAQITDANAKLYKTASFDETMQNIICILHQTYFVEIVLTYDEDFYKVNYNGITGYVKRTSVKMVNETPLNPYPKAELLTINNNVYLRSSPEKRENNNIVIIPSNSNKLNYIGYCYGEQVDDFRQNIWYYVEYLGNYGYIYGEYIYSISTIQPNIEYVSFVSSAEFDTIINPLSNGYCALIVFILLLPTVIVIGLMYKKPKPKKFKEKIITIKEYEDKL